MAEDFNPISEPKSNQRFVPATIKWKINLEKKREKLKNDILSLELIKKIHSLQRSACYETNVVKLRKHLKELERKTAGCSKKLNFKDNEDVIKKLVAENNDFSDDSVLLTYNENKLLRSAPAKLLTNYNSENQHIFSTHIVTTKKKLFNAEEELFDESKDNSNLRDKHAKINILSEKCDNNNRNILEIQSNNKKIVKLFIVCTLLNKSDEELVCDAIKKLGISNFEKAVSSKTTHLVTKSFSRTLNMLKAISRGCWILDLNWIKDSLLFGKWCNEENYELKSYSPSIVISRLSRKVFGPKQCLNVFKKKKIVVTKNSKPNYKDLTELIKLCGGIIIKKTISADIIIRRKLSRNRAVPHVTEQWAIDSICQNIMMDIANYRVFD